MADRVAHARKRLLIYRALPGIDDANNATHFPSEYYFERFNLLIASTIFVATEPLP
jgi:hypothetical protein